MHHEKGYHHKGHSGGVPPNWNQVERDPMFLMQFVCREYVRCLQKRFHQQDEEIRHKGRGFPLYVLMEDDTPVQRDQKEIAAMLGIAPSTMTGALKRLEASGLIEKHQDPHDQRRKLIGLTEEGLAFIRHRRSIHDSLHTQALGGMSPEEQEKFAAQMADIYTRLLALAEEPEREDDDHIEEKTELHEERDFKGESKGGDIH